MEPTTLSSNAPRAGARCRRTRVREAAALALCMLLPPALATVTELPLDLFSLPLTVLLLCSSFGDLATFVVRRSLAAYRRMHASLGLGCVVLGVNELWDRIVDPVLVLFSISQGAVHTSWTRLAAPMPAYDSLPSFAIAGAVLLVTGGVIEFVSGRDRAARRAASSPLPSKAPVTVLARGVRVEERPSQPSQEAAP